MEPCRRRAALKLFKDDLSWGDQREEGSNESEEKSTSEIVAPWTLIQ